MANSCCGSHITSVCSLRGHRTVQPIRRNLYADLDRVRQLAEKEMGDYDREDYEKNMRPFFKPVHAMGIADNTEGIEQGISKGVFFILISE